MPVEVRRFLLKAQENKFATFEPTKISAGNISVNVVNKIDLSKIERRRNGTITDKNNTFIIDTNVFVDCPDIISRVGSKNKVVIPTKVLEELDKLKLKPEVDKFKINEAARNINLAFTKNYSRMVDSDASLLPSGFDKNNPDCLILSVALKLKNENPILLTSDNILMSRASGMGIQAISLKDFLKK